MPWVLEKRKEKIPPEDYDCIRKRMDEYAAKRPWAAFRKLHLHFKGCSCYVNSIESEGTVDPLCRLDYVGKDQWRAAFYKYSNERYEPCILPGGSFVGSLEEAFSVCELYLI